MSTAINTFDFIPDGQRIMYETAFNAVTQLELWTFLRDFEGESFMFSDKPEVDRIYKKIEELGYDGHSGGSFGCILRTMQYIAKYGIDKFKESFISSMNE